MTDSQPHVLVTAASRHGSTQEIAEVIASQLAMSPAGRAAGLTAVPVSVDTHPGLEGCTAVVLGSAVYAGRWLEPARTYAASCVAGLRQRPVWLFSSGPIGEPPFPPDEPHDVAALVQLTGAREHRVFAGRLDKTRLNFGERAMVTAMRAPLGDFRNWDEIRAWADHIAAELVGTAAPPVSPPAARP